MTAQVGTRVYRVSPAQEWMLTLQRLRGLPHLQLTRVIDVGRPETPDGVRDACRNLAARQTALRTRVVRRGGRFTQEIVPVDDVPIAESECADIADPVLAGLVAEERREPVDLRRAPARFRLVSTRRGPSLVVLTCHHALADWWSMETAAGELLSEMSGGGPAPAPVPFAEYADRLAAESGAPDADGAYRYWSSHLSGAKPPALGPDLPAGHRGWTTDRYVARTIAPASSVRSMAKSERVTVFAVLLAAFAKALHRLGGERDVVVGTQLANRVRPELRHLMGCFTTTVLLRLPDAAEPLPALSRSAQRALAGAYRHGQVDPRRLMRLPGLSSAWRATAPSVLFQFVPADVFGDDRDALPEPLATAARPGAGLPVDLHVAVSVTGGSVRCEVDFNGTVFERATVARLVAALAAALRAGAEGDSHG
ncbi:condensation domain-containing protein [Streptomyces albus subsp. chlorinus]|uniref:condensation domain-containing protein n=1 Tax=Streptomyces albus TaxID=1888 RepID=UPI0031F6D152